MATVALPRPIPPRRSVSPSPLLTPTLSLDNLNTSSACPLPVPNKHIPVCPPGPAPAKPDTPPASPPSDYALLPPSSLLYPPDEFESISSDSATVYSIDAAGVAAALDHLSSHPLPHPTQVFPWLHGLHPSNHIQQSFFIARRRELRKAPTCFRGITIVKAGGDLAVSRLKGAIAPDEFLQYGIRTQFKEIDPKEGFSVRNFQIQTAKIAMLSDIIVYGENQLQVRKLAWDIAAAQGLLRETSEKQDLELPHYNTFMCTSPFQDFESSYPNIVAVDSQGHLTGKVLDFFHQERLEMCTMTKASELGPNVWLGPTPDLAIDEAIYGNANDARSFDIYIDCSDVSRINSGIFKSLAEDPEAAQQYPVFLDFPSSGSVMPSTWSLSEIDGVVETCKWIHRIANPTSTETQAERLDSEGDTPMPADTRSVPRQRKILIHCTDGYTETTMLALAYYIYSTGLPVHQAWLDMHKKAKRNFFAYPSDVVLLSNLAPRLLMESPASRERERSNSVENLTRQLTIQEPGWLQYMDGSLPSRITDYMYLGNLGHANNPDLLRELGIGQVLSVGEMATWREDAAKDWGEDNIMLVQRVQDNGVDPLTEEFERCLGFIGMLSSLGYPYSP